jgi:hypothetical protein
MALEGTIKDFGLPDIFQLIGLQRKTGLLTLKHEQDQVTVFFENGMVVNADSASKRLEDRLGNVLVKQGKLSRERLEDALTTQRQTLQRLGHILAASSAITTRDLRDALSVQVAQIVFRVFRWRDGRYQFNAADTVDYDRENFVPMSTDFILMEGIRMVDEWPIIEKKIPSMDIVFKPAVDPNSIEVGGGAEEEGGSERKRSAASSSNKIRLTPEEERIFRKVDGTQTVQGIIDSVGTGVFRPYHNFLYVPRELPQVCFIECKASRSDFLRDLSRDGQMTLCMIERKRNLTGGRTKRHRSTKLKQSVGLGKFAACLTQPMANLHYVLAPQGIIQKKDLPPRWGLLTLGPGGVSVVVRSDWQETARSSSPKAPSSSSNVVTPRVRTSLLAACRRRSTTANGSSPATSPLTPLFCRFPAGFLPASVAAIISCSRSRSSR